MTTLEHPPYSSNLALADFYLFSQLESAMKGWRFCAATVTFNNATEELKGIHKMVSVNVSNAVTITGKSA
jgi:hypothetical protein